MANGLGLLDALAFFSDGLQIYNTFENKKQTTLLEEFQKQDSVLSVQDNALLEIIQRLERIEAKINGNFKE